MHALAVIAAVLVSAGIWLWYVRRYDKIEPEPLKTLLKVGFLGGLISVFLAGTFNTIFIALTGIDMEKSPVMELAVLALFIGFNEETMKALAAIVIVRKLPDFNEPVDGLIYSMTVALGFAALENFEYIAQYGLGVIVTRTILSVPGHLFYAAVWGYGISKAKFMTREQRYFRTALPYIAGAALLHAFYDFVLFTGTAAAVLVLPLLFGLLVVTHKRLKWMAGQSVFLKAGECPVCRGTNQPGAAFCGWCGTDLEQVFYHVCPGCGSKIDARSVFCPNCGLRFENIPSA
ncbi:MAG: PrsW family glutamic-type intramembrane protease [Candidatus Saccharibacteria bacterium]